MKEITCVRSEGQRLVIEYNELGQPIGQNAMKLKSFIRTTVRFHVPITYSDWPMVPKEIKDKIFELIKAEFVVDPRSKKTIIQNAGICFQQQHWTEFVASLLKEDFKKKSENGKKKWKQHKYNHKTSRKGYANLIEELDELVDTQKTTNAFDEEDILTRALGGKDHPGIVCGVGKYVTKKKIKEFKDELLKMKEKDDCLGELKEEPGMGSKEKSSMEGAENLNNFEDLSNDLQSQKDVEDVVELNEEIKMNIVKDDEQVEDVEGANVKVAVDVVVDGDWAILIPSNQAMYKMSQELDYGEFSKDMTTFAPTPIQTALVALQFLLRMVEHICSKEERAQLLTARLLRTDYDQLLLIPYNFGSSRLYVYLQCPKQSGVVERGYYVMRFMHDIILSKSTSIIA
ncbi:transposase [Cucumis melo var. makuwa]|uniref:Transposase n=1 Tax=Cucumis melo var. makuwa TaxID=1194695 RepID=A0A5A7TWS0_CUCMM|nr:transposase [Cucumis melo var. makuwa]TYK08267.1 transposase [Cucumis melo var. makuwa]